VPPGASGIGPVPPTSRFNWEPLRKNRGRFPFSLPIMGLLIATVVALYLVPLLVASAPFIWVHNSQALY